ncbi:MAG TPA: hypothetical protein VJ180_05040 [Pyrinomonadaceae bacterium]|nr:hypothetical protein [Pyrinomonadaceae bacterium]
MKVREVIMRAIDRLVSGSGDVGISCRQMRRWKESWEEHGYDGLFDQRCGKPSPKRVPVETVQEGRRLNREQYFDFNVRHFHAKLGSNTQ